MVGASLFDLFTALVQETGAHEVAHQAVFSPFLPAWMILLPFAGFAFIFYVCNHIFWARIIRKRCSSMDTL